MLCSVSFSFRTYSTGHARASSARERPSASATPHANESRARLFMQEASLAHRGDADTKLARQVVGKGWTLPRAAGYAPRKGVPHLEIEGLLRRARLQPRREPLPNRAEYASIRRIREPCTSAKGIRWWPAALSPQNALNVSLFHVKHSCRRCRCSSRAGPHGRICQCARRVVGELFLQVRQRIDGLGAVAQLEVQLRL